MRLVIASYREAAAPGVKYARWAPPAEAHSMALITARSRKMCSRGHDQRGLNFCPVCNPGRAHRVALIQMAATVDDDADRLHVSALRDRWSDALRFVRCITPFAR